MTAARAKVRLILLRSGLIVLAAALAGCGSVTDAHDLPPAAEPARSPPLTERPAGTVVRVGNEPEGVVDVRKPDELALVDDGRAVAVVSVRERVLEIYDSHTLRRVDGAPAGVGPTHVIAGPGRLVYVVDTTGDGLLVYELRPRLHLTRRLPLLGKPYGIARDPEHGRVYVTLTATNRLVELADGARPHRLRDFPAVRQPDTVAVNQRTRQVCVTGRADGVLQRVDAGDTAAPRP
jgi:DNA-binding beta-propeller fold protein YncE